MKSQIWYYRAKMQRHNNRRIQSQKQNSDAHQIPEQSKETTIKEHTIQKNK